MASLPIITYYRLIIMYVKVRRDNKFFIVLLMSIKQSTPDFMLIGELGIYKIECV